MSVRSAAGAMLAALVVAALLARPLAHGIPLPTWLAFWATVLGQVLLPGVLLVRAARLRSSGDAAFALGQGASVGLALQGIAFFSGRALGAPWLGPATALVTVLASLALAARLDREGGNAKAPVGAGASTLGVALVALLLQPLSTTARVAEPVPFDLLFHAGTAGELRHRWPLEDPRVAGVPLHYHVLAYALPIAAADLAAAPLADPLLALAPLVWVGLLALQMANAGRVLLNDARAGALGGAVALLHADPGELLGLGPGAFNSHFATAVYGSPTTACSLVLLLALAIALAAWIEGARRRELAVVALLSAAASAAKTTLVPVVLGGLALAALLAVRSGRRGEALRLATACATVGAAAAPFSLWQTFGASSYSRMAHFGVASSFTTSRFASRAAELLGPDALAGVLALPLFLLWLAGFLGLAGAAAACGLANRRPDTPRPWVLATVGVALVASLLVDAPGLSQLFLLYNGQLLLCLFAGAGLAATLRRPARARDAIVPALLLLMALPALAKLARALPAAVAADARGAGATPSPLESDYAKGLAWLRANASRDAVVFADNPSTLLSGFAELRLFYETGLYTARSWEVGPGRDPYPERAALQERLLRRPDAAALAAARAAVGAGPRLLVVADAVQSRIEAGLVHAVPGPVPPVLFFPAELFQRIYLSPTLQVYEARR